MLAVDTPSGVPLGNSGTKEEAPTTPRYYYLYRAAAVALIVFCVALLPMINRGHVFGHNAAAAQSTIHVAPTRVNASISHEHPPKNPGGISLPGKSSTPYIRLFPGQLTEYREEVQQSLRSIRTRWQVDKFPNFLSMMNIPELSWNIQKNKFIKLLLESKSSATPRSKRKQEYVLGFTGSSVTAGHDSFFNESFPFVLERRLAPIFRSLFDELPVVTRNHAMGNNPCYPYDACVATHIGEDVDLLAWEQSMNCGHDEDPLEMFARSALAMPSKPTVMYVLSGTPFWTPEDCKDKDYSDGKRPPMTSVEKEIMSRSRSIDDIKWLADNSTAMHSMTFLYATSHSASGIPSLYSETAPMAQTVNAAVDYACYGPYVPDFSRKTPGGGAVWHPGKEGHELRGDVMAFFLLSILEDAIRTVQMEQFDELETRVKNNPEKTSSSSHPHVVNKDISAGNAVGHRKTAQTHPISSLPTKQPILRNHSAQLIMNINARLLGIAKRYLDVHTSGGTAGGKFGKAMLLDHPHPAFCSREICDDIIPQCYTDYEPRMSHGFSEIIVDINGWEKQLSFFDVKAVAKGEARGLGYVDRKWIYVSQGVNTSISFYVHVMTPPIQPKTFTSPKNSDSEPDSRIRPKSFRALKDAKAPTSVVKPATNAPRQLKLFLCEVQKGFLKYPDTMDDLPTSSKVTINLHAAEKMEDDILRKNSAVLRQHLHNPKIVGPTQEVRLLPFKDFCYESEYNLPAGKHVVTVTQTGTKQINLAYVLFK